ncbi:hypothetical protein [Lysobacter gummosus]|uniref:3-dehydroquinate dehydratase n=1 Tax=Lysobacter gummosus TaxID=262324 RepID=A0ABY3X7U3_9GAMM|nr:hypothetical protein [Lysobacter gummosus]UNP28030.1 hypothetical protein MOV92_16175 [Lysobacter gummosus]
MSIVLLRGPKRPNGMYRDQCEIDRLLLVQLIIRANRVGRRIAVRNLASDKALIAAIQAQQAPQIEAILLDTGACVRDRRIVQALQGSRLPYVEIRPSHLTDARLCEPEGIENRIALVRGVQSQTYVLALSIALEHITREAGLMPRDAMVS